MELFVTGATGVMGRPTVRALVEAGHTVRGLARSEANVTLLRSLGATPVRALFFDAAAMREAASGCDALLHLATKIPMQIGKRAAWNENDQIRRDGTRILVDAALAQGVATVIYPSICFVYPESAAEWIDATGHEPVIADYYRSTFDAEAEVARFSAGGGRGIVLRMGLFYGPESPQSQLQLSYARRWIATTPGQPNAYHPFLAIEDAARAVVAAALQNPPSGTYDIAEDAPPTTAELTAAMAQAVGHKRLFALPAPLMRMTVGSEIAAAMSRSQRVSNHRFREATGWRPQVATTKDGWLRVARKVSATA